MISLQELYDRFPEIKWHEPVEISVADGRKGYACRVCIAQRGLKARDYRPMTHQDVMRHLREAHGVY